MSDAELMAFFTSDIASVRTNSKLIYNSLSSFEPSQNGTFRPGTLSYFFADTRHFSVKPGDLIFSSDLPLYSKRLDKYCLFGISQLAASVNGFVINSDIYESIQTLESKTYYAVPAAKAGKYPELGQCRLTGEVTVAKKAVFKIQGTEYMSFDMNSGVSVYNADNEETFRQGQFDAYVALLEASADKRRFGFVNPKPFSDVQSALSYRLGLYSCEYELSLPVIPASALSPQPLYSEGMAIYLLDNSSFDSGDAIHAFYQLAGAAKRGLPVSVSSASPSVMCAVDKILCGGYVLNNAPQVFPEASSAARLIVTPMQLKLDFLGIIAK